MKAIVIIVLSVFLTGCSILQQQPIKRTYLSLNEIKGQYGLTNREYKAIVKDARTCKCHIGIIYHAGRDEWMYDATVDYSIYKAK